MSDWYYAVNNEQKGPINESELKANLAANKIPADALVWKEGMDNWTPASQVPAFTFRPPPTPARVQPPVSGPAPTVVAAAHPGVNNPQSTQPVDMNTLVGTPEALEVDASDAEKNKIYGILCYVPLLFILALIVAKDSPFAKYHANQGLVLLIALITALLVLAMGSHLPIIGFVFSLLDFVFPLVVLIYIILGVVNAAAGKCVPLPVIGGIKIIK